MLVGCRGSQEGGGMFQEQVWYEDLYPRSGMVPGYPAMPALPCSLETGPVKRVVAGRSASGTGGGSRHLREETVQNGAKVSFLLF